MLMGIKTTMDSAVSFLQRRRNRNTILYTLAIVLISTLCIVEFILFFARCSPVEDRFIALPDGTMLPFHIPSLKTATLAAAMDTCAYNDDNKLVCPNVKHKGKTVVRQMQLSVARMVKILDVMSDKHEFSYWLWAGALIGANRNHRMVPWDQDADIGMLKQDYDKFVQHAIQDLPSDIFLQTKTTDVEYAKVRLFNEAKLRDSSTCYGYCARRGCKFHDGYQMDIMVFNPQADGVHIVDTYDRFTVKHDDIFPLQTMLFEGFNLKVPHATSSVLLQFYGDVTRLPVPEKRCTEYVGVPWSSCDGIAKMNATYRQHLLEGTMMTNYPTLASIFM